MKTAIFPLVWSAVLLVSCSFSDNEVKDFMPGTYVASFRDSLNETTNTVGNDTVEIKPPTTGSYYEIKRRMKFQRTVDGVLRPEEHKIETWKGIYDEQKHVIMETTKGKIISFIPEKELLLVNATEYKKLK